MWDKWKKITTILIIKTENFLAEQASFYPSY
jgi:hypothetical protein